METPSPAAPPPPRRHAPPKSSRHGAAIAVATAIGAVAAWLAWPAWMAPAPPAPAPFAQSEPATIGLGYLEPASTILKVAAPGGPDSSRIARLNVSEGDVVVMGQPLAVLDSSDKLEAQLQLARAQADLKRLALHRQRLDVEFSTSQRKAALERARADLASNKAEFDRQQELTDRSISTAANLEKKKRDYLVSLASVREMEAALLRIESTPAASNDQVDVAFALQELIAAEAELKVAEANVDQSVIVAPVSGRIFTINAREGERIGSDGLLELGAVDRMRAVVEVYQTDIGHVTVGQTVVVSSEALDEPVPGRVSWISPAVKRQTVVNNDPATATDARVIPVYVEFDATVSARIAKLSRLQIKARFKQ